MEGGIYICEIFQNGVWASLIYRQPIPCFNRLYTLNTRPQKKKGPFLLAPHAWVLLWTAPFFSGFLVLEVGRHWWLLQNSTCFLGSPLSVIYSWGSCKLSFKFCPRLGLSRMATINRMRTISCVSCRWCFFIWLLARNLVILFRKTWFKVKF